MNDTILGIDHPVGGVMLLTLNRPHVLNAVDLALARSLKEALDEAERDDNVRAIVLTGAGDRAFSSGYDIKEMADFDLGQMELAYIERDPLIWQLATHPKPVVAALNGITWGVGALYAAAADIRVGCPRTNFRVTATMYGGSNATFTLPHIVGVAMAKDILLTSREVEAEEMRAIGLITRLVDDERVVEEAISVAEQVASHPPTGPYWVKRQINENIGTTYVDQWRYEYTIETSRSMPHDIGTSDHVFRAFLAKTRKT